MAEPIKYLNALKYSLTITNNENGKVVDLYNDEELVITSIDGMDYQGDIQTTTLHGMDGSIYEGTIIPERTLTINVQYKYTPKDEEAKLRLHAVCVPRTELTIHYETELEKLTIKGYCEKCDTPPNTYPMVTNIVIICPDPWWYSEEITVPIPTTIDYQGIAPTEFVLNVDVIEPTSRILLNVDEQQFLLRPPINGGYGWQDTLTAYSSSSHITVDGRIGRKAVNYNDGESTQSRFIDTAVGMKYPKLKPGTNVITYEVDGNISATITYAEKKKL